MDRYRKTLGQALAAFVFAAVFLPLAAAAESPAFSERFAAIKPEAIEESVFTLVGEDWTVLTAGDPPNSMVTTFGGFGMLMDKPGAWSVLAPTRYTLEKIEASGFYTMSYFDREDRGEIVKFGQKSGRDGSKMKDTKLTPIVTPGGGHSFAEAKLVIELRLAGVVSTHPDDFSSAALRDSVTKSHDKDKGYSKIVFGEIVGVWRRK